MLSSRCSAAPQAIFSVQSVANSTFAVQYVTLHSPVAITLVTPAALEDNRLDLGLCHALRLTVTLLLYPFLLFSEQGSE